MKKFTLIIIFMVFSCSVKKSESITTIDSIKDQSIYFSLPLGMTLDEYEAMYNLENYKADNIHSNIDYIDYDCAVISVPAADEIAHLDEEIIAMNTNFIEMLARNIAIDGVQILKTTEQYVNFKGDQRVWHLDLKKNGIPEWKVVLFKVTKDPIILPEVLVTRGEVDMYFENSSH